MVVTNTDSKLLSTSMAQTLTGATRRRVLIILKVDFTDKYVFILILFSVYFQSAYNWIFPTYIQPTYIFMSG